MDPQSNIYRKGRLQYLERCDLYQLEKPYQTTFSTTELGGPEDNISFIDVDVSIRDAQGIRDSFKLEKNGFEFQKWVTGLTAEDFDSDTSIVQMYYPEVLDYVTKTRPSPSKIHIMGHQRRDAGLSTKECSRDLTHLIGPARFAHTDFSPAGSRAFLDTVLKENPELCGHHYEFLNVWRVTRGPNSNWPLAVCDYQSLCIPDDIEAVDIVHREYVGEQFFLHKNPGHKWYFLENEAVEDVILFKHTDSRGLNMPFSAHAAFENDASVDQTRRSVEVRLICFY